MKKTSTPSTLSISCKFPIAVKELDHDDHDFIVVVCWPRVAHGLDDPPRRGRRLDMRDDDPSRAGVQIARQEMRRVCLGPNDRLDAYGARSPAHVLHPLHGRDAMLTIDEHAIETEKPNEFR